MASVLQVRMCRLLRAKLPMRFIILMALVVVFLSVQLFQARSRISKLEHNDRAQTGQISGLADIATKQNDSVHRTLNLVGQVIGNQQRLVNLYTKGKKRQLLSK